MPKFTIYEVQEQTVARRWKYEVEAADEDTAEDAVHNGEVQPIDCGEQGDVDYGASGWITAPAEKPEEECWAEATANLIENV